MLLPEFEEAVIHARLGLAPPTVVDDLLAWIALSLTTYSMVTVGFLTVMAWNALTFDRRDAMVLGSLPLRSRTILGAKLAALATFVGIAALSISAVNAVMFGLVTSNRLGAVVFLTHVVSMFVANLGASVFIFAAIVALRGVVTLAGGPWLVAALGPPLQFLFIVFTLCLVVLSPAVWQISFVTASLTDWMPPAWFVGVFEGLRGSARAFDPAFEFAAYMRRALMGTTIAVASALLVSVAEFHRQMRAALAPSALSGPLGASYMSRRLARLMLGRHAGAGARADFILVTLARNRPLQMPIAISAAVGATFVITALSRNSPDLASLMRPRTALLWIPLVMSYWITVGLRASFSKPSELPAAWSFRASGSDLDGSHWLVTRAAMIAFVVPRVLLLCGLLVPLLGWTVTIRHTLVVLGLTVVLIDLTALLVRHMPFTRAYEPGQARLRTRWFLYAIGFHLFAYWPARIELRFLARPRALLWMLITILMCAMALEVVGRLKKPHSSSETADEAAENDAFSVTVLDIARVTR